MGSCRLQLPRYRALISKVVVARFALRLRKSLRRMWHLFQPHTALFGMDKVVAVKLPFRGGVFVEVGANDGVTQSNTYFLGRRRGWSGLLIEPVPWLAKTARRWRSESEVVEVCVTSPQLAGKRVDLIDLDLVTQIDVGSNNAEMSGAPRDALLAHSRVRVPTATLTQIFDENNLVNIDFLSIDVEGHELEVLAGLDMKKHQPTLILIETAKPDEVHALLNSSYRFVSALSHHDYLYESLTVVSESSGEAAAK